MRAAAGGAIPASEFKAKCLELMDRVAEGRDTYVITKHGRPVAKLVPADPPTPESVFGCMADQTEFVGDLEPLPGAEQEAKAVDRERAAQWKAWEREWLEFGVAGRKTGRQPSRGKTIKPRVSPRARPRRRP
jgi:prevent-host-death family protein